MEPNFIEFVTFREMEPITYLRLHVWTGSFTLTRYNLWNNIYKLRPVPNDVVMCPVNYM